MCERVLCFLHNRRKHTPLAAKAAPAVAAATPAVRGTKFTARRALSTLAGCLGGGGRRVPGRRGAGSGWGVPLGATSASPGPGGGSRPGWGWGAVRGRGGVPDEGAGSRLAQGAGPSVRPRGQRQAAGGQRQRPFRR